MRQEHFAHIRQTHLIKDLLRCGSLPGRKVGVILVVALAGRSGAGWLAVRTTVNIGCQLSVGNTGVDLPSLIRFAVFLASRR